MANSESSNFCEFIGISVDKFWEKVISVTNRDLFSISDEGVIERRFEIGTGAIR